MDQVRGDDACVGAQSLTFDSEEGARFPMVTVASSVWAGSTPLETAWPVAIVMILILRVTARTNVMSIFGGWNSSRRICFEPCWASLFQGTIDQLDGVNDLLLLRRAIGIVTSLRKPFPRRSSVIAPVAA